MRFLNQRNRIYVFRHIEPYIYYIVFFFPPHEKDTRIRPTRDPYRPLDPRPQVQKLIIDPTPFDV